MQVASLRQGPAYTGIPHDGDKLHALSQVCWVATVHKLHFSSAPSRSKFQTARRSILHSTLPALSTLGGLVALRLLFCKLIQTGISGRSALKLT